MAEKRIDGKKISEEILVELEKEVAELKAAGVQAGLAVVQVGNRTDSSTYIRMKKNTAEKIGLKFFLFHLPSEETTEQEVLDVVRSANENPEIHGLIVQLPLPKHINENTVTQSISPLKDVDGLHADNVANLVLRGKNPKFVSCTPKGCIELLKRSNVEIAGKNAVVIGRSNIVGIPMAHLLLSNNATVTICHSQTVDLPSIVSRADIVVAAIGRANFVQGEWLKEGAVVIDVGINSVPDESRKAGYRLVGDVDYNSALSKASLITPVPGGVGPMT